MARPPDEPDEGTDAAPAVADDDLSPRARRIRAMIEAGTYDVDLDALAESIAASGDLERVGPPPRQPANDQRRDDD